MSNHLDVFTPDLGSTITVTIASSSVAVSGNILANRTQYTVYNSGADIVFVEFGAVATKPSGNTRGSYPIGPGVVQTIGVNLVGGALPTTVSVIGNSATSCVVYVSAGSGF